MSNREVLRTAGRLLERGEPFALASVVRRTAPSSARAGRRALVEADGTFHGWLAGSCIEPVVRREAMAALRDGEPRLLVFSPEGGDRGDGAPGSGPGSPAGETAEAEADGPAPDGPGAGPAGFGPRRSGTRHYPMTCHSGGTVEVYIEPELPAPVLTLFGDSPVSRALAAMAPVAGYRVEVVGSGETGAYPDACHLSRLEPSGPSDDAERYAVVATMGDWDEDAVRQALEAGSSYVGLVASPRRAARLRRALREDGLEPEERLSSPAGLDLGAREPEEIAVTILAEIVQRRRADDRASARGGAGDASAEEGAGGNGAGPDEQASAAPTLAVDPVCGMEVEVESARHVLEHEERVYYFCCAGCRSRFADEPARFVEA